MTRLSPVQQDSLDEAQAVLWESIVGSRSGGSFQVIGPDGGLVGPFNAMVFQPGTGSHWEALGALLRFNSTMEQRLIELIICTVGAHFRADFEFGAHALLAQKEGISVEVIEALRLGEQPPFELHDEALIYDVVHRLLQSQRVPAEVYSQAVALVGQEGLGELASVIGYYSWISVTLNLFEVAPLAGLDSPWPEDA